MQHGTQQTTATLIDQKLARIAVARGLVSTESIAACEAERQAAEAEGRPGLRMAQLLVRRGLVSTQDLVLLLREAQQPESQLSSTDREPAAPAPPPALPRSLFGGGLQGRSHLARYELVREIARGGMGVVYEGIDPDLRRRVALKVLRDAEGKEDHIKRLHREAAVAARLSHPGIIPIHEVGSTQEAGDPAPIHFIAMDYVEGQTLADALGRLDRAARLAILEQVADAVGYAHEQGVIHRDLKPANILLTREDRPIVTDFGLARRQDDNTNLTVSGAVMGTSHYMAPEQVLGRAEQLDARCDVWALGVMLYELLADRRPFEGQTQAEVYHGILRVDPPAPRGKPAADRDLQTICHKALEKELARRYASGREVAAELQRWREGEPILARPPSKLYRLQKLLRRHPWFLSGTLLWIVLIALAAWWAHTLLGQRRQFATLKARAGELFRQGNWNEALVQAERATALARDAEVERWTAECQRKLDEEQRRRELQLARHEAFKKLQERIQPISRKIEETRPVFNIPRVAIAGQLAKVELALAELERIAREKQFERWRFPDAWALLGSGYYLVGRMRRAEHALLVAAEPARTTEIEDWWVNYHLGRIYLRRAFGVQTLFACPEHPLREQGWRKQARVWLERPMEGWEGSKAVDRHIAQSFALLARGDLAQVARRCDEGLVRYRGTLDVAEYWHLRGYTRSGRQRIADWDAALQGRPHDAWIFTLRGMTHDLQGDAKHAKADYDQALRVDRRLVHALNNRGVLHQRAGRPADAQADFQAAIREDDRLAGPLVNAGWLLCEDRRPAEGLSLLVRATRAGPRLWQTWWLLGRALAARERRADARAALRRALELAPPSEARAAIEELLKKLE